MTLRHRAPGAGDAGREAITGAVTTPDDKSTAQPQAQGILSCPGAILDAGGWPLLHIQHTRWLIIVDVELLAFAQRHLPKPSHRVCRRGHAELWTRWVFRRLR